MIDNIFNYVLKNFNLYYEIGETKVSYGISSYDGDVVIHQHAEPSFFNNKEDIDIQNVIWKEWKGVKLPFCFDRNDTEDIITQNGRQVIVNYDIIASAFYFLSGWNEFVSNKKDDLGRVAYEFSVIKSLDIVTLPVVNYYFDILYEALLKVKGVKKRDLWSNHSFAVTLTHDIDTCLSAWKEGSLSELKKGHFFSIPKLVFKALIGKDDWYNFQLIAKIDKKFGLSSTFFFLPRKGELGRFKNADYNVKRRKFTKTMETLIHDNFEVGVHGSFGTHANAEELIKDMQRIKMKPLTGNRFHFLMFDVEKTIGVLETAGIRYDTSLGFAEHIGFRRAFCNPFFMYDFANERCSEIVEIPLMVMDATLHYPKYMGINRDVALKNVIQIIDEVKKHNGVFTILWHNTFFSDYKYSGWRNTYIEILNYCTSSNALITNGREIYERVAGS